jgi:hypothetical protein
MPRLHVFRNLARGTSRNFPTTDSAQAHLRNYSGKLKSPRRKPMTDPARIVLDPLTLAGSPMIRGPRLTGGLVIGLMPMIGIRRILRDSALSISIKILLIIDQ